MEPSCKGLGSIPTMLKQSTLEGWINNCDDDNKEEMSSCYVVGGRRATIFLPHQLPTVKSLLKDALEVESNIVPRRMELKAKEDALKQSIVGLLVEKRLIERQYNIHNARYNDMFVQVSAC